MKILATHTVLEEQENVRLSDYLVGIFEQLPSRKSVKKAIKRGEVRVNNETATTAIWVQKGMWIEFVDLEKAPPKNYPLKLKILYEDDYLAAIEKPAGIVVSGNFYKTLFNALSYNLKSSQQKDALPYPLPVHRLDSPTSGILLVAKTRRARIELGKQFEDKIIQKKYKALTVGEIAENGAIEQTIEGKYALTYYRRLKTVNSIKNQQISLVELKPITGRTHQLRKHLAWQENPILGDSLYGKRGHILKHKGLFLHAYKLTFNHPETQEKMTIMSKLPYKFEKRMEREQQMWKVWKENQ